MARDIARTYDYALSCKLRKKVEMHFVRLKSILGLGRLRLRGPNGASDQFLLAATSQNLRKLAKLLPMPKAPSPAWKGGSALLLHATVFIHDRQGG
jgi:hypothetical protein